MELSLCCRCNFPAAPMSDPKNLSGDSPPSEPVPSRLTDEHRKKVNEWFLAHLKTGTGSGCPLCGNKKWSTLADFVVPANFTPGGGVSLGGDVYPHFMLVCNVCSNVQFINAIKAGVLGKDGPK